MEDDEIQQRIDIASHIFPLGARVCNTQLGSASIICGAPFFDNKTKRLLVPVRHQDGSEFLDDVNQIVSLDEVNLLLGKNT